MQKIRVYCIFDDTYLFHPRMLHELVIDPRFEWIGVAASTKDVLGPYMMRHVLDIGLWQSMQLAFRQWIPALIDLLMGSRLNYPLSLRSVAQKFNIPFNLVHNVNSSEFISHLKILQPDVIVSSNSQIFKKPLLSLSRFGCINRHSALLPRYGGILPVFQAVAHNENKVGVTVHLMEETIDTGVILTQEEFQIEKGAPLYQVYQHCFSLSVGLIFKAIDIVTSGVLPSATSPSTKSSYFSFPTREDWDSFKKNGGKFI